MKQIEVTVSPEEGYNSENLRSYLEKKGKLLSNEYCQILRRSIDARQRDIKVNMLLGIDSKPISLEFVEYKDPAISVHDKDPILIIGAGPAGLFAALKAIELGVKPIVFDRGKDVRSRRRDIAAINKKHIVDPDSNYCFGEGGAGTYSDGKLYTRAKKRGSVRRIFEIFVAHGATEEILYESHPHIGTNKLPKIVAALRDKIIELGGEVHFESKVVDFLISGGEIQGVELESGEKYKGIATILATGHSARDIFHLSQNKGVKIEAKPFALGVRIEHPQAIIDQNQYKREDRGEYLPAASYSLVHQTRMDGKERGVFSFCMCPGGFIVPAATSPGELVVNGMSPSRRDSQYANSGVVVAVELEDLRDYARYDELAGLHFQADVEKAAWEAGGKTQTAPAQRITDFMDGKSSTDLIDTSYQPGLLSTNLREVLPLNISKRLKQGIAGFGRKMRGYITEEAQMVGVESRTSSPVKIPRDQESLEHIEVNRLYPSGEGAGFAGGIVSAAMDGERCAEMAIRKYFKKAQSNNSSSLG